MAKQLLVIRRGENKGKRILQGSMFGGGAQSGASAFAPWKITMRSILDVSLVVCLITMLLGTSVFVVAAANGSTAGYYLGYFGAAFSRFTQFFTLLLMLAWIFTLSRENRIRFAPRQTLPLLLTVGWLIFQLIIMDPTMRGERFDWVISSVLVVLVGLPFCRREGYRIFFIGMLIAGILFIFALAGSGQLFSILTGQGTQGMVSDSSSRLELGLDTISSASICYQCALAGILWLVIGSRKSWKWYLVLFVVVNLIVCALMTGSKGPLVAFILAIIAMLYVLGVLRSGFTIIFALFVSFWFADGLLAIYKDSASHLAVAYQDVKRLDMYLFVLSSKPTLFGNGPGSFGGNLGYTVAAYPHNAFLEMYYEYGLVGLGLFSWMVYTVGSRLYREARKTQAAPIIFIMIYFVYALGFAMFSGSILADIPLWLASVLGCARFGTLQQMANAPKTLLRTHPRLIR